MKTLLLFILSASYALSQCQANPKPNASDPQDPKTVCIGPLATTGGPPGAQRFPIGGVDPAPQKGFVWISVATGKAMISEDGLAYRLIGPAGKDGVNGVNGKDGAPGKDGLPGKDATIVNKTCSVSNLSFSPAGLTTITISCP